MIEIENLVIYYQEKFLDYYSKMKQSIDYVTYLQNQLSIEDYYYPEDFQRMYPQISDTSLNQLHNINATHFRVEIIEPFLKSLDNLAQEKLLNIWVGHVPIRRPNAFCAYVPRTIIPIVIIYNKIFGALSYHAESYLIFNEFLKYDKKMARSFRFYSAKKLVNFFTNKNECLPLYNLPWNIKQESVLIACVQDLFLIAHELAHIFLDHLDLAEPSEIYFEKGNVDIKLFSFDQKLEFEADLQAAKWIVESRNKGLAEKELLTYINHFDVIAEIFVLLNIIQVNSRNVSTDEKHPPAEVRLQYIFENLKENFSKSEIKGLEDIFKSFAQGFNLPEIRITKELDNEFSLIINNYLFKT